MICEKAHSPGFAGIELIFFLVAGAVPCFGFGVRTMLTAH